MNVFETKNSPLPYAIAVVGPTASGKTALAIELAKEYNGEIISCDSMQIYKRMDIGTAKPTQEEQAQAVHHMIDIAEPEQSYSCADWVKEAHICAKNIVQQNKIPIFCGGTGLYLDSLLSGTTFSQAANDEKYRENLLAIATERGVGVLHKMLEQCDAQAAQAIHPNNVKRVIRALEIYHTTGIPKTEWDKRSRSGTPPFEKTVLFGLCPSDREILKKKIDERVDLMMENGLLEEVKELYRDGLHITPTASQAIGYKELFSYLEGNLSLNQAIDDIKTSTRQYAKRQLTWFSSNPNIHWIQTDKAGSLFNIMQTVRTILQKELGF